MYKIVIYIMFFFSLSSCATLSSVNSGFALNQNSNQGLLILSISYQGSYSGYSIQFSNTKNHDKINTVQFGKGMALIPIPPKGDYSHLGRKGELFAIELPKGTYQITGWRVLSGYATIEPSAPISVNFTINPGKGTYIGNFNFIQTKRMGLAVTGVNVAYSEQSSIDYPVLKSKFPNIDIGSLTMGIEPELKLDALGGTSGASWDIPIFIP